MKKTIIYSILLSLLIASCKVGEEDPGLSLLSRKQRLTGEWNIIYLEDNFIVDSVGIILNKTILTYDGLKAKYNFNDTVLMSGKILRGLSINNDGSFKMTESKNLNNTKYLLNTSSLNTGYWFFNDETKVSKFENK